MAVFTRAGFLLILNLLFGPRFGASFAPAPEKKHTFLTRTVLRNFQFRLNTLLDLTVNIRHNHVDIVTVRVRIRGNI